MCYRKFKLELREILDIDTHYFKIFIPNYEDGARLGAETYFRVTNLFEIKSHVCLYRRPNQLQSLTRLDKSNMKLSIQCHQSFPYP